MKKKILRLLKIPHCEKCGSIDIHRGTYTTGWNNYCNQASGDSGYYCMNCQDVYFDKSFDERKKTKANWCTIFR